MFWAEDTIHAPWSHPACWEAAGVKGEPELNGSFRDTIIIGDIHGTKAGLMMVLTAAGVVKDDSCQWADTATSTILIQIGDVVDRGKFSSECYECLRVLQRTAWASASRVVRLLGNHELLWLRGEYDYRNRETDSPEKINELSKQVMVDVLRGDVQGAFYMDHFRGIPVLLTHAGVRGRMKAHIESTLATFNPPTEDYSQANSANASVIAKYINDRLYRDVLECSRALGHFDTYRGPINCRRYFTDKIYTAGPERGGRDVGGSFWTDFSVLMKESSSTESDFIQIVGHTVKVGEIRSSRFLRSICVDAGMMVGGRAYLQLSQREGRFLSHHWRRVDSAAGLGKGEWVTTDMNGEYCS